MGLKSAFKGLIKAFFVIIPKNKKKIMFESFSDFCDNSRAFYEFLLKEGYDKNHKLVWCVDEPEKLKQSHNQKNVVFTSYRKKKYLLSFLFHAATSKTIFYTHARPPMTNTKTQDIICLWHGIPLKRISLAGDPNEEFTKLVSCGEFYDKALIDCFKVTKDELVTTGFPRNDLLFEKNNSLSKLNINPDEYKLVALWMPTFRKCERLNLIDAKETQTGFPFFNTEKSLKDLNVELSKRGVLLITKIHPLQDLNSFDLSNFNNIRVLKNSDLEKCDIQLYHLVGEVDCLITDYSSIYLDYLLLNRPIGFLIDDMEEYKKSRGFVVDDPLSVMPGEKMTKLDEFYSFLDRLLETDGNDKYEKERIALCDSIHFYKDGNSCQRIANRFLNK